jgi:hypothetical protein
VQAAVLALAQPVVLVVRLVVQLAPAAQAAVPANPRTTVVKLDRQWPAPALSVKDRCW